MRNPILVGQRVYLRPLEISDATMFAEATARETDTFMDRGRPLFTPITWEYSFQNLYTAGEPSGSFDLAVCLKENDQCIGRVGLDDINWFNRIAETNAWFGGPEMRNQGYGTEAKHLLLEYAFDHLHLEMLISCVFEPNWRSMAALKKQGYRPAGSLKFDDIKDGVLQDFFWFDLNREDWLKAREQWQKDQQVFAQEMTKKT